MALFSFLSTPCIPPQRAHYRYNGSCCIWIFIRATNALFDLAVDGIFRNPTWLHAGNFAEINWTLFGHCFRLLSAQSMRYFPLPAVFNAPGVGQLQRSGGRDERARGQEVDALLHRLQGPAHRRLRPVPQWRCLEHGSGQWRLKQGACSESTAMGCNGFHGMLFVGCDCDSRFLIMCIYKDR